MVLEQCVSLAVILTLIAINDISKWLAGLFFSATSVLHFRGIDGNLDSYIDAVISCASIL